MTRGGKCSLTNTISAATSYSNASTPARRDRLNVWGRIHLFGGHHARAHEIPCDLEVETRRGLKRRSALDHVEQAPQRAVFREAVLGAGIPRNV